MIVLIAAASAGIAYFVANSVFGSMISTEGVKVQTIDLITSEVTDPDKKIFNEEAINPSVEVNINETKETDTVTPDKEADTTKPTNDGTR